MKNIIVFASGSGTNAERIGKYFSGNPEINVSCILTNNPKAGVIERAKNLEIDCKIFNRNDFYDTNVVLNILDNYKPDLIVLAGFLWLVPENMIDKYNNRIINIHPALLPKYGGKGMYGMRVHEAVIEAREQKSGITIHWVNKFYDEGQIIFQESFIIDTNETPESLARRIHELEYRNFPVVIERLLSE